MPAVRGSYGTWRGRDRLRLVGARRGEGAVVWSDLVIPAAYELDVFSSGTICTIQGNLEGDFSQLRPAGHAAPMQADSVRLRLDDGHELDIDLVELGPWFADFSAAPALADAAAIVQR